MSSTISSSQYCIYGVTQLQIPIILLEEPQVSKESEKVHKNAPLQK